MSDHGRFEDTRTTHRQRDEDRGFGGRDNDGFRDSGRGGSIFGGGQRERSRFEDDDRGRFDQGRNRGAFSRDRDDRRDKQFGRDDDREGLPIDETGRLIASNKVEDTAVYGRDGERLGSIYNFMVDKFSGKVEYAVMTYGGFLGMGIRYYPLPWKVLSYDTRLGGYRVHLCERDLRDAPSFDRNSEPRFDRDYGERVNRWYGLNY